VSLDCFLARWLGVGTADPPPEPARQAA
jgi:hypothetical protein